MTRFEELCDERHRTAQKLAHPPLSTTPYLQQEIRRAKAELAEHEASKARRRAAEHGKAHGRLVWTILRRSQRDPAFPFSCVPRDALRIIIRKFVDDEVARLAALYAERLAAGAASWRGL